MKKFGCLMLAAALASPLLLPTGPARAGRFEGFMKKAAEGEKMKVVAATYFGGPGLEEFVDAGQLEDGTIVAFGNAWGPEFPAAPAATVLGHGRHAKLNPYGPADRNGHKPLRSENPDIAGMLVVYADRLASVKRVVRFDWGVASISAGAVARDGKGLLVAGRCTPAFRTWAAGALKTIPLAAGESPAAAAGAPAASKGKGKGKDKGAAGPSTGPYEYEGAPCTGDVFLARLSPAGDRAEWVWVFEGLRKPAGRIWTDKDGAAYAEFGGMVKVAADGNSLKRLPTLVAAEDGQFADKHIASGGPAGFLAVDPADGGFYFGGDRNTHTGFQPYRQPFLYRFGPDGKKQWKLWEWPAKDCACGGPGNGLCADSSPRVMDVGPDGDLYVGGWSDGGNSVLAVGQPTDLKKPRVKSGGFGMDNSGMKGANSISHILRLDAKTQDVKAANVWVAYVPDDFADPKRRGSPNATTLARMQVLHDGSVAFTGAAATGLVQTPNAFYKHHGDGRKYGGSYVAAFSADFRNLTFSSYLPGCENVTINPSKRGLLITSRSRGSDGDEKPTPSPTVGAVQKDKQGEWDGHIVLLELPGH